MSIEAFRRAYSADRIGRAWMYPSKDYAGGYHRGLDVREVHPSGNYSVVTDVIAISPGVVDYIGRPNTLLGPTIRIKRDEGGYEFHSHSIATATTGTRTTPGTRLGRNARMDEKPGQVGGVHDHIVFSDHADGAWNTKRATHDPMTFIRAVIAETAGGNDRPFPENGTLPEEDTLSAAEVDEIKRHVTAEANRTIAETAQRVMTFVIPSYVPGPDTPTLGKLIRALFQDTFTPAQRQAIATGYEPGVKLDRYAKSDKTGSVFALYTGTDGVKYRYRVTDPAELAAIGADVTVLPQADLWGYGPETGKGHELETDFAVSHPGEHVGYAVSDATGNLFALFRDSNGNQARRLITDPAEKTAHADAPTMAQADLWAYAPINQ